MNSHTFSQADFDEVGEVLLCPKPLGLLEMPELWANTFRNEMNKAFGFQLNGKTRICIQPTSEISWVFHNYNKTAEEFEFTKSGLSDLKLVNEFTGEAIETKGDILKLTLPPRSRIWVNSINQ